MKNNKSIHESDQDKFILLIWILYHLVPKDSDLFSDFLESVQWNEDGINSLSWLDFFDAKEHQFIGRSWSEYPRLNFNCKNVSFIESINKQEIEFNLITYLLNFEKTLDFKKELFEKYFSKFNDIVKIRCKNSIIWFGKFILGPYGIIKANNEAFEENFESFYLNNESNHNFNENYINTLAHDAYYLQDYDNIDPPQISVNIKNAKNNYAKNWNEEQIDIHFKQYFNEYSNTENIAYGDRQWHINENKFFDLKNNKNIHSFACKDISVSSLINDLRLAFLTKFHQNDLNLLLRAIVSSKRGLLPSVWSKPENSLVQKSIREVLNNIDKEILTENKYKILQILFLFDLQDIFRSINSIIEKFSFYREVSSENHFDCKNFSITEYGINFYKVQTASLVEDLSHLFISAYQHKNRTEDLNLLLNYSKGISLYDKVLHYVISKTPIKIIKNLVDCNPYISSGILELLFLDCDKNYDITNESDCEFVANKILFMIGKKKVKQIFTINNILINSEGYEAFSDIEKLKNMINELGRGVEKILTHIVIFVYLININRNNNGKLIQVSINNITKSINDKFNLLEIKSKKGYYYINDKWTLADLQKLIMHAGKLHQEISSFSFGDKLNDLKVLLDKYSINKLRNAGSHYTINSESAFSITEYKGTIEDIRMLISEILRLHIFPGIFHFKSITKKTGLPYEVVFKDSDNNDTKKFYFSKNIDFKENETFAVFDITQNNISINPIVIEWFN